MGSVGKALFGGSDQKSSSGNVNNGAITGALNPAMGYVGQAGGLMSSLLGGDQTALNNFSNSGGMKFLEDQGQRMVTSSSAAKGLLNSGGYGEALQQYGQNLGSTYLNQYLQNVNNLGQLGLGSAGVVSDAGRTSSETSNSKNGIIPGIAGLISASHSDRRVKKDIEKIGEYADGLGKYRWTYIDGYGPKGRIEGVMADEVKTLRPWAYVADMGDGYAGVNYNLLGN